MQSHTITVYHGYIIDGFQVDGQLFGDDSGAKTTISLENDEVVTAIEYYNFPESGYEMYGRWWTMELCAMSIFTNSSTETHKQYGPFSTDCWGNATERVYGEIPSNMSFKEFLSEFSYIGSNDYLSIILPPWTSRDPKDFNLPEDYTLSDNSFYKPYGPMNLTDAKAQCESDGASLATPRTDAEKAFLFTLIPNDISIDTRGTRVIWIGLIREDDTMLGHLLRRSVDGRDVSYTTLPFNNSSLWKFVCSYSIANSLPGIKIRKRDTDSAELRASIRPSEAKARKPYDKTEFRTEFSRS